jgi:hypothetical protein
MLFDPLAFFSSSHPPSEKAKEYIYVEDYKLIRKWIEAFLSPDHDELLEKKLLCELKGGQKPLVRILQIGSTGTMGSEMSKKDAVKDYQMYIDGRWERSSSLQSMEVVDPYNGNIVARVQKGTREDAKKAILAAHKAADDWGDALASKRADHL